MEVLLETHPQALSPPSISPKDEKGLRFHPPCQSCHPVMVSQIPAKDMRVRPESETKGQLFTAIAKVRVSFSSFATK